MTISVVGINGSGGRGCSNKCLEMACVVGGSL